MWGLYSCGNPINFPLTKIGNFNNWLDLRLSQEVRPFSSSFSGIISPNSITRRRRFIDLVIGEVWRIGMFSIIRLVRPNGNTAYSDSITDWFAIITLISLQLRDTQPMDLLESQAFRNESIQLFSLRLGQHIILLKALGHLNKFQVNKGSTWIKSLCLLFGGHCNKLFIIHTR